MNFPAANPVTTSVAAAKLPTDGLLKFQQVADLLQIHRATLYDWINKGDFPAPVQIRGRNFYRAGTVAHWLDAYAPESRFNRTIVKH